MSGALDDDTRRTLASGRETVGAVMRSAQKDLQKIFIAFVLGLVGSIWFLRTYAWERLKVDLFAQMPPEIREATRVVAVTPFDVILLQVKIGLIVGGLLAVPLLLYFSRDALRRRGWWPQAPVARWKLVLLATALVVLFVGGIFYAYTVFFPIMFSFLATNAINAGFTPTYHIVKWAQFVALLALSFGLAAELPLMMSTLAYSEIVPYETFRDKWKYAVLGLYAGGAVFTPPDPLTQLMWATPLVGLYAVSLRITRLVVVAKRSSDRIDVMAALRERWNVLAGSAVVAFGAVWAFFARGGIAAINRGLDAVPYDIGGVPTLGEALGVSNALASALVASIVALLVVGWVAYRTVSARLDEQAGLAAQTLGDPSAIDLDNLDAAGVEAAPPEAFESLAEEEALAHAQRAMDDDDPEKAELIIERFDEAAERADQDGTESQDSEAAKEGGVVSETTTNVVDAFTEEETTEEDIGGYYYDLAFIFDSLTSKAFRVVAVFGTVLAAAFMYLYTGGIDDIRGDFVSRLPAEMAADVDIVNLHPVEHLIFEIKFSTLLALVVVLPLILYYIWPALKERGYATGDRRVLLVWGGSIVAGLTLGSYIGYTFLAPSVISWLAADALEAHMVVAYRINSFGWLVVFTTVGIGLLAEIPMSMVLFDRGGIVSYQTMREYWRGVVIAIFVVAALLTPSGMFSMLLLALPAALAYLFGLGLLWVVTLGGRRGSGRQPEVVG
ncbi:preprotein translocase subunit TatC [Halorhabdus sp. CBA1104]|uniref:twin-arginine translocase subunit TatC n=1 Tax=Halorhabdus sp. CBA1104 TaxID=1380432 RepID=UPI0012B221B5|nr:twin-arginine translocase subunit TatC [Halorhabdus sp. CBA1104]QGN07754.1 preprotein translocase subunit TatC [Halorhabdus sp. CBA1104]